MILGEKRTKAIVQIIGIPTDFALKFINVFFMPPFVLLPLSPSVSGVEIGKIIGVFIVGFVVIFTLTAYLTLWLQLLLGASKRSIIERAEEMGGEEDDIPLTDRRPSPASHSDAAQEQLRTVQDEEPTVPDTVRESMNNRDRRQPETTTSHMSSLQMPPQVPPPLTRSQRWATHTNAHLDTYIYLTLFMCIGLPLYYTTPLSFAAHLPLSILSYFAATSIPTSYARIVHPVILSSGLTDFGIYLLAASKGQTIQTALRGYTTKTRYLQLFAGKASELPLPGAGDILSSLLDVSIVALALPMYNYRLELRRHFPSIMLPNIVLAVASLFGYPALSYALGISPSRSLSFASRSLTLALATPATQNLGGDLQLVAVLCIMSGVMGVLIGPTLLKWLRIPEDDYVTRGVTMGANSSAIATAVLLGVDPRAAALSCLSMTIFGTVMVGLCSVPPVVEVVRGLVGR